MATERPLPITAVVFCVRSAHDLEQYMRCTGLPRAEVVRRLTAARDHGHVPSRAQQ
jgi:hypothetical protein